MLLAEKERYVYPSYLSTHKYDTRAIKLWEESRLTVEKEDFFITRSDGTYCLRWGHNKRCILHYKAGIYNYIAGNPFTASNEEYDNPENWEYWSPYRRLVENMKLLIELLNSSVKPRPFKELYSALRTLYEEPIHQYLLTRVA